MWRSIRSAFCILALASFSSGQGSVLYSTDFSDMGGWAVPTGSCASWATTWAWAVDATPASHPFGAFLSPPSSLNFNDGTDIGGGDEFGGPAPCGRVRSDPIDLSSASSSTPYLRFWASWECETDCLWDVLSLEIRSASTGQILFEVPCLNGVTPGDWSEIEIPLERAWGAVQLEFVFDTADGQFNQGSGPFIDDLEIVDVGLISCLGDGSAGACPCGNGSASADQAGCLHSGGGAGALRTAGLASLSNDTLVLHGSGMTDQPALYFQGTSSGAAVPFGDGLRCTGGGLVRLGTKFNAAGASSYPGVGDPAISVRGQVGAPGLWHYQAYYRDPAAFCTPAAFNLTNALSIVFEP